MVGGPEVKVSTVDVESGDNTATLPVSRAHTGGSDIAEKNNATNKEMELKNVMPRPLQRYYTIFSIHIVQHHQHPQHPLSFPLNLALSLSVCMCV
jgi:hypothetical protein